MSNIAIVLALVICGGAGFLFGYIVGRDSGNEEGRDQQWMEDFFLTLETQKRREQSNQKRTRRKD